MIRRILLVVVACAFIAVLLHIYSDSANTADSGKGVFKPVHLVNLNSDDDEAEFLELMKDLNAYLAELGIKDIKYQAWKAREDQDGKYQYIFESKWPDQATYDKAHDSEPFKKMVAKWETKFDTLLKEHEYCRYIPLN